MGKEGSNAGQIQGGKRQAVFMKITKILVALEGSTGLWEVELTTQGLTPVCDGGTIALSQLRVFSTVPYEEGKVFEYFPLEDFCTFINHRNGKYDDL